MSEPKTKLNDGSVNDFIATIDDQKKQADSRKLLEIFTRSTGEAPKMWGSSIIGFGQYHYKSEKSSQQGDWMLTGFSPRKQNLTLYIMQGFEKYSDILQRLGKYKTSKSCLYLQKLEDVDISVLEELIIKTYLDMKAAHPKGQ